MRVSSKSSDNALIWNGNPPLVEKPVGEAGSTQVSLWDIINSLMGSIWFPIL